ncbi:MAG: MmgE/PrpD family protein, partial [Chloroflexota bacterium]
RFVVETDYDRMPPEAVNAAKRAMLDTIGVTLAGSAEPQGRIVARLAARSGCKPVAGIIGGKLRVSCADAALANGTAGHALDYDDTGAGSQGHPSVPVMPAAFALGEEVGASGKEAIAAYILGVEVWSRVAYRMPGLHMKGWHPTATFGTLGAAAAAAKILRLNVQQTVMALGIAGSEAGGLMQNFGTMTKPFHAGNAARNGVVAALLARDGFTATDAILEGEWGFPLTFYGHQEVDVLKMADNLGAPFAVVSPGINVKKYPACFGTHRSIDAMLQLIREHNVRPDEVAAVDSRVPPRMEKVLFHTSPCTGLEGKFSMQFCMAVALTDRRVGLSQVNDARVNDPAIRELMKKVKIGVHADWVEGNSTEARPDIVTVKLKDGREYSLGVDKAKGHADVPLTRDELLTKYRECARLALVDNDVERSIELVENLEKLKNIKELLDVVVGR